MNTMPINDNFITLRKLVNHYAAMGLIDKKAAEKAFAGFIDGFASLKYRFAVLCMCNLSARSVIDLTGDLPIEQLSGVKYDLFQNLIANAVAGARDTPEGSFLYHELGVSDESSVYPYVMKALGTYRDAIARQAFLGRFKAKGGYQLAESVHAAIRELGFSANLSEFMCIYHGAVRLLPWQDKFSESDVRTAVDTFLKGGDIRLLPLKDAEYPVQESDKKPDGVLVYCNRPCHFSKNGICANEAIAIDGSVYDGVGICADFTPGDDENPEEE